MRRGSPNGFLLISLSLMAVVLCGALVIALEYAKTELKIRKGPAQKPAAPVVEGPWAASIKALNRNEFAVTQNAQDDAVGAGRYVRETAAGIYVEVVSREPLFSSTEKLEPLVGYAEFSRPLEGVVLVEKEAVVSGEPRLQVWSKAANSYLGWLSAPAAENGRRYVINSSALKFVPAEQLESAGLGKFRALFPPQ